MDDKWEILQDSQDKIFIFGITDLAFAALKLLWSIEKNSVAFVDNSMEKQGKTICGVPVLSPDDAFQTANHPIILICVYNPQNKMRIMNQISTYNIDTICFTAEEIMQKYILYIRKRPEVQSILAVREVGNWNIIERYSCSADCGFDIARKDIQNISAHVAGIMHLEIRIESRNITEEFVALVKHITTMNNILFIIIKTDPYHQLNSKIIQELNKLILYIKFYNYPSPEGLKVSENNFLELEKLNVPFSYIVKDKYPIQKIGCSSKPLTKNALRDIICNFIGVPNTYRKEYDKKICLFKLDPGLGAEMLDYLTAKMIDDNTSLEIILDHTATSIRALDFNQGIKDPVKLDRLKRTGCTYFQKSELCEVFGSDFELLNDLFNEEEWNQFISKLRDESVNLLLPVLASNDYKIMFVTSQVIYDNEFNVSNHFATNPAPYLLNHTFPWKDVPYLYTDSMENPYYHHLCVADLKCWKADNRRWAQSLLRFPEITDAYNLGIEADILNSDSVTIHIRRGDMADCGYFNKQAADNFESYFQTAINAIENINERKNKKYYIFSDDIEWCKAHEEALGIDKVSQRTVYVTGNTGKNCFRDMQLMSKGKILVLSPSSTYSICAFILSTTVEKYVCFEAFQTFSLSKSREEIDLNIVMDAN